LHLENCDVHAYGHFASGVGGGFAYDGSSKVNTILLESGSFEIVGQDGAGIGAGYADGITANASVDLI
jgi:hypothetical protein